MRYTTGAFGVLRGLRGIGRKYLAAYIALRDLSLLIG
jgi:hypothetical protein